VSYRTFVRIASAALAIAMLCSSAAPAAAFTAPPRPATKGRVALVKPPATAHPDRLPGVPGSPAMRREPTGRLKLSSAGSPASTGAASIEAGGIFGGISGGSGGTNNMSFANFDSGDIVVVLDPTSLTGHAGIFDRRFYSDVRSYAVLSANVAPLDGVQREQCLKYRTYDRAYALWVPSQANHGAAARDYAYRQMGKPYSVLAAKTDLRSFYCSKLAWVAWRNTSGVDLDADGGFWVWPVDLVNSRYTSVFGYWS
jgi:cell wall-associated NlpC family hydrolase